jgi:hypothetical protein
MTEPVNLPSPQSFETKDDFRARWAVNPAVRRAYPALGPQRAALERQWAKAKARSLVSVTTSAAEVLLFD